MVWDEAKYKDRIKSLELEVINLRDENNRIGQILNKAFDNEINKTIVFLDPETTNEICIFEKIMEDGLSDLLGGLNERA